MGLRWGFSLSAPTARLSLRGASVASASIIRVRRIQNGILAPRIDLWA